MTSTYVSLATITLTSTDSEIVFSSIPNTYRDLVVVIDGTLSLNSGNIAVQFNGDAGATYPYVFMLGSGSGSGSSGAGNFAGALGGVISPSIRSAQIFQVFDYSQTNKHKSVLNRSASQNDAVYAITSRWPNTNAINSLRVLVTGQSFAIGSSFSLYGIN